MRRPAGDFGPRRQLAGALAAKVLHTGSMLGGTDLVHDMIVLRNEGMCRVDLSVRVQLDSHDDAVIVAEFDGI